MKQLICYSLLLLSLPSFFPATAQSADCPKGFQPYGTRCVSQRMADYISCVEASGGNKAGIADELEQSTGSKATGSGSLSAGNRAVGGSLGIIVDRNAEQVIARRIERKWFSNAMAECTKALDPPRRKSSEKAPQTRQLSQSEYVAGFFDPSKPQTLRGSPFPLNEPEAKFIEKMLGSTSWQGGPHWGVVIFDASGRVATYTNETGRASGKVIIQGAPPGTVPLLVGEWNQEDGQSGRLLFAMSWPGTENLKLYWGPAYRAENEWTRKQ